MTLYSKATMLLIGCFSLIPSASASLIQSDPFEVDLHGTGFGNVSTIITLQTANGQSTSEAGCIGFGNSTSGCGIAQNGKIKNSSTTEPVPAGVTSASQLRFILNAAQPSGNSITLNDLEVSFYGDSSSTALYTATLAATPLTLTSTLAGTGASGFVFQLDSAQAASVDAILSATTAIGGGFQASNASGGQDTLFLGTGPGSSPGGPGTSATPEPSTYALLGGGLAALSLFRRKRANAQLSA